MHSLQLEWEGVAIAVVHTPQAFSGPFDHIELRAEEILPVTETGYRSHFIHPEQLALFGDIPTFVTDWLNEWAKDPKWHERKFQSQQMEPF